MNKLLLVFVLAAPGIFCQANLSQSNLSQASAPADVNPFPEMQPARAAMDSEQARETALKEHDFVEAFNRLTTALADFSREYKTTHSVNAKKAKAVRDAYRKLEQIDPWFRPSS